MAVVANAGPLISLARIDQLALLPALYSEVIVPPVVYQEITTETDLPGAQELAQAEWLRAVAGSCRAPIGLRLHAGAGERAWS